MPRTNRKVSVALASDAASPFAEAYRTLRVNIEFCSKTAPVRSIAVASPEAGDGRSTTALHLAVAYARSGKRVALVDADLRMPSLHAPLVGERGPGLAEFLSNPNAVAFDVVRDTPVERLAFVPAGGPYPAPADGLGSPRFERLLDELKHRFDVVVLDGPPMLGAVDAKLIAAKCDGVVLVVRRGALKREAARKVASELEQANARLLGAVINHGAGRGSRRL